MTGYQAIDVPEKDLLRSLGRLDELVKRARAVDDLEVAQGLRDDSLRIVWDSANPGLAPPRAIIGRRQSLDSVLPRLLSQPGAFEPVTSMIRTWEIADLHQMASGTRTLESFFAAGIIGLMIGEIQITGGGSVDIRRCGLDLCRRTLTFTIGSACTLGASEKALPELIHRWFEVSDLAGSARNFETGQLVGELFGFLLAVADHGSKSWDLMPQELASFVGQWHKTLGSQHPADLLTADILDASSDLLRLSRESRYSAIMQMLDAGKSGGRQLRPLERGFLVSLIDPGSFDFFDLATMYDDETGSTVLAYALCAGILGGRGTVARFNGFGAHVLLKGLSVADQLNVDISLHELRIARRFAADKLMDFRTRNVSAIDVEIFPRVVASFAYGAVKRTGSTTKQPTMSDSDVAHVDEALHALDFAITVLNELKGAAHSTRVGHRRSTK